MSKKLGYLLAAGALVVALQWGVPAAYSAVVAEEEAAESCPIPAKTDCPSKAEKAEV